MGEDVWILTRPSINNPLCYTDKFIWVREHLGMDFARKLILCTDKGRVGTKDDVLIDDYDWKGDKIETPWKGTQIIFGSGECNTWVNTMVKIKEFIRNR